MEIKNGFSKKIVNIINSIWTFVCVVIVLTIKDRYNLNFWIYLCIAIPLLTVGQTLINKFIKANN